MKATHGSVFTFGKRGRLIGCCIVLALALSAFAAAPAANAETTTYLALGAQNPFGYNQQKWNENFPNESPSYFDEGYTNLYTKKVAMNPAKPENKELVLVNDGCPGLTPTSGEETATLYGPTFGGTTPTCAYQKAGLPLHNGYPFKGGGPERISQLEDALSILKAKNPITGKTPAHPVKAISLDVGGNDEQTAIHKCKVEVEEEFKEKEESKYGGTRFEAKNTCVGGVAKEVIESIIKHLGTSIVVLHNIGKYESPTTEPIILLGFYNPKSEKLPGSDLIQSSLNFGIEQQLLPALAAGCYGKIKNKTECEEAYKSENGKSPADLEPKIENVKFVNPFLFVNPQGKTAKGTEEKEYGPKGTICKYTEECNPIDIAANNAKETSEGFVEVENNGDDSYSKAGYEALATRMFKAAPL